MIIYLYRTIDKCVNGYADLCHISSRKLQLTKSGELAQNQAPFDKQGIINTESLKLFKIRKPRPNVITKRNVDNIIFTEIMNKKYCL